MMVRASDSAIVVCEPMIECGCSRWPLHVVSKVVDVSSNEPITFSDVLAARERLDGVANVTPVITSRTLDDLAGRSVFLKCENLQRGGAFKFRGASNTISQLSAEARSRGVLAFSSGNHAQGVALAAKL